MPTYCIISIQLLVIYLQLTQFILNVDIQSMFLKNFY